VTAERAEPPDQAGDLRPDSAGVGVDLVEDQEAKRRLDEHAEVLARLEFEHGD
jgi:hypothetical protein